MGLSKDSHRLRTEFSTCGLPPPKETLARIRLALAADLANTDPGLTRAEVAKRLNYSSGTYLAKHAKALTGLSWSALVEGGLETVFEPKRAR